MPCAFPFWICAFVFKTSTGLPTDSKFVNSIMKVGGPSLKEAHLAAARVAQPPLGASGCPTRRGGAPTPNNAIDITEESRGGGPPSLQHLLIVLGNRIISASKRASLMLPLQNHLIKTLAIAANVGLASLLPPTRGEHGADSSAFAYLCVCSVSERFFF